MSLVSDQIRRLDAYLDRFPVISESSSDDGRPEVDGQSLSVAPQSSPRLEELLRLIKSLSTTSSSQSPLALHRVRALLVQSGLSSPTDAGYISPATKTAKLKASHEDEIEWLLVTKATVQVYGSILQLLLDQIMPLSDGIWYWNDVLSSYAYSSLYTVQTSPLRFCAWSQEIYSASTVRIRTLSASRSPSEIVGSTTASISQQWQQFYGIVRDTIRQRSLSNVQTKVLSPVALARAEARRKQAQLRKMRELTASGLGVLMDEGLQFGHDDEKLNPQDHQDLKGVVERSVALMGMVLAEVCTVEVNIPDFEDKVFAGVEEDPELSVHLDASASQMQAAVLAQRLIQIIDKAIPQHSQNMRSLVGENGRPSRVVRYWLPALIGVLSSTTILRILTNRKDDIINWIRGLGQTTRDFWFNWIVTPAEKVIKTIRHDESSEIAIMSRDSLKADRESLERMVVEFAKDKPHFAIEGNAAMITDAQIADIRSKVAEGDVTPVLKAYEKDLRKPFMGAVRGDLVRSLLIQVQKTKVDLEVAMTGIDSLLKSQELVFGFVGLTPGILVTIGLLQYFRGVFSGRSGLRQNKKSGRAVRILRNVDRILSEARPTENNVLSYKDHGLLLCEVHQLRSLADGLMPRDIQKEFLEDLDDLANVKGISVQAKALDRIRWAYGRWLK